MPHRLDLDDEDEEDLEDEDEADSGHGDMSFSLLKVLTSSHRLMVTRYTRHCVCLLPLGFFEKVQQWRTEVSCLCTTSVKTLS